jgi:hypothetical protein
MLVLCDRSQADYSQVRDEFGREWGENGLWLSAREWLGKRGFWKVHQTVFYAARRCHPSRYVVFQDDVQFQENVLAAADQVWSALDADPRRLVLYLMASSDDEPAGRWIHFPRRELPEAGARLTQWFDLQTYMADRRFLELMRYRVFPVPAARWLIDPKRSSGVGEQFTQRSWKRGNIYQAYPTLVTHGSEPSRMNPEARRIRPLDNRATDGDHRG